jgi:ABC-2 type transport system ATP-binding protein
MTAQSDQSGIDLQHVTRRFGKTVAVNDLSLSIPLGTTCGFIGLNGAGKTTTIRMLVGLLRPSAGTITVAGHTLPADRQKVKRKIGYVPDRPTVYSWMKVRQAMEFCELLYGPQWNQPRCNELMKILRLDPTRQVKHLSKGSAAKLSLLLAIGHDPDVLILDEPTSGFDPLARDEFLEGVLSLGMAESQSGRRRTVLFSSHALTDVQRLADSVALIHEGRLLLHQPTENLLETTKRIRAVLGDPGKLATVPPPGTVHQQVRGREWTVTVKDFSPDQVEFIRSKNDVQQVDVVDLTLDDVFRDYVRATQEVTP